MQLWLVAGIEDAVAILEGAWGEELFRNRLGGPVAELKLRTLLDCLPVDHRYVVVRRFDVLHVLLSYTLGFVHAVNSEIYAEVRSVVPWTSLSGEIRGEVESLSFVDDNWIEAFGCLDLVAGAIDPEVVRDHLRSHEPLKVPYFFTVSVPNIADLLLELIDPNQRVLLVGLELLNLPSHVVHLGEDGFGPVVLGLLHLLLSFLHHFPCVILLWESFQNLLTYALSGGEGGDAGKCDCEFHF